MQMFLAEEFHDIAPPVDYSRTRGLVGEIMNELKLLDEKNKMLEEAAERRSHRVSAAGHERTGERA